MARDPYEILGVSRDADDEEIRRAYRRLAKQGHPDTEGGGDEDYFCALNEAYEKLRTEERRRAAGRRAEERRGHPGPRSGHRSGPRARTGSRPRPHGPARGRGQTAYRGDDGFFGDFDIFSSFSGLSDMLWRIFDHDVSGFAARASGGFGHRGAASRRYHVSVELSPREAAEGVSFEVVLPEGSRRIEVPPGVDDGDELSYSEQMRAGRHVEVDVSVQIV